MTACARAVEASQAGEGIRANAFPEDFLPKRKNGKSRGREGAVAVKNSKDRACASRGMMS